MIPYGKHHITEGDIQEFVKALKSDFSTQHSKIAEFENSQCLSLPIYQH